MTGDYPIEHFDTAQSCALQRLLEQRYGDGTLYLCSALDRDTLRMAQAAALVSGEGCLTAAGREFISHWDP